MLDLLTSLVNKVQLAFETTLGEKGHYVIQAPGRVNLIGEHTDYNDGFVMPSAINYQTVVVANKRQDNIIRVISVDYGNELDKFTLDSDIQSCDKPWANYVRGVVKHLKDQGFVLCGVDMAISGNVPQGAGLSSSAALEVVVAQTFKTLCQLDISQEQIALTAQAAENKFVGCNCGIMDQLISAKAKQDHALLIDCRSLESTPVPLPEDMTVVIVNSNKTRGLVDSEYNTRRAQCEAAAAFFGVTALRDVSLSQFEAKQSLLDPVIARRAKHIITENARTLAAAEALKQGDILQLQALMAESHASMRDDFEITVAEIDTLVEIIKHVVGDKGGVRMTGGGFGGCVVSLVPNDLVDSVVNAVEEKYPVLTGLSASIYLCRAEEGAGAVTVLQK